MPIYAEDPANNWAPSPGASGYREPGGPQFGVTPASTQGPRCPSFTIRW